MDGTIRNSDRRPPRPLSAKPSRGPQTSAGHAVARRVANPLFGDDEDDLIGEELFQSDDDDDNGENDFEAEALAAQHRLMEQDLRTTRSVKSIGTRFRPTSAPVNRSRPQSARMSALERQEVEHERAAMSVAYLKQAKEKKKKRESEFARELLREETEYKKKMSQKIDQANRMVATLGVSRTFSMAPDRDGLHMVKISDPATNERVVSVENFLREFERLASVQIGQVPQRGTKNVNPSSEKTSTQDSSQPRKSKLRIHGIRTSRLSSTTSMADLTAELMSTQRPAMSNSKRLITKTTDRALVQEELKSVLASTIDLTKVLQDQLHELKLKGWNYSSRIS